MKIEKVAFLRYNKEKREIEEDIQYRITYKNLMVLENNFSYALSKMILYMRYKNLLAI